jgi:hypothetical protein
MLAGGGCQRATRISRIGSRASLELQHRSYERRHRFARLTGGVGIMTDVRAALDAWILVKRAPWSMRCSARRPAPRGSMQRCMVSSMAVLSINLSMGMHQRA